MSLAVARTIATTALTATQVQLSVTSANIANADTDGYTRKMATQTAAVTAGVGSGVSVTGITSKVDRLLLADLVAAAATASSANVTASYLDSLQSLLGSTSDETSLATEIAAVEAAFADLAVTPESESLKAVAVDALDTLAIDLRDTSAGINNLRSNADAAIADAVTTANDAISTIDTLNGQIVAAKARGQSTADLEDQRNQALLTLSETLGVTAFTADNGAMKVYTEAGQVLVDGTAHLLSFDTTNTITAATVYDGSAAGLSGVAVDGRDVTASISSGSIAALLELRDETLPAAQDMLDALAEGLIDQLNAVHNGGTASPPANVLTGTVTVSSTDTLSATGTLVVAVTDADGLLTTSAEFDLSSYATVGDLTAALDAADGLSASLDASGRLVIAADDASGGVALTSDTSFDGAETSVSAYFGLNDLLRGSGASDIAVRDDILATPGLLATATLVDNPVVGETAVADGSTAIAEALGNALTATADFPAAGSLRATSTGFADYAADILGQITSSATKATAASSSTESARASLESALSAQAGVNIDEETARLEELESLYSTAAQVLSVVAAMHDALLAAMK